ncbi:MAG: methylated-DNA--[protein]-cysteine S-methyltransferase [Candidatus Lokiarchaeota archaeon]|nr:methylated-DNA--[protein]-cysteine S-methyltransferase [Candidatus Lokiarchaeota archaeon]
MSKTVSIMKKNDQYVAGIFTDLGLFSTSLPHKSKKDAIVHINGEKLDIINTPDRLEILDLVFRIESGNEDVSVSGIKLDFSGLTDKQKRVYTALLEVPRGETITYGELAELAGISHAARFVGTCMANNRLGPIVPCHRVVASSNLGGYGPGLEKKEELLKKEGAI